MKDMKADSKKKKITPEVKQASVRGEIQEAIKAELNRIWFDSGQQVRYIRLPIAAVTVEYEPITGPLPSPSYSGEGTVVYFPAEGDTVGDIVRALDEERRKQTLGRNKEND